MRERILVRVECAAAADTLLLPATHDSVPAQREFDRRQAGHSGKRCPITYKR